MKQLHLIRELTLENNEICKKFVKEKQRPKNI